MWAVKPLDLGVCVFDANMICSPCLRSGGWGIEVVVLRTVSWKRQKKKKDSCSSRQPTPAALLSVVLRSRKHTNTGSGQIVDYRKLVLDI